MGVLPAPSEQTAAVVPTVAPIAVLPIELVAHVLSFVTDTKDLVTAASVCREWYRNCVESLWSRVAPTAFSQLVSIANNVATSFKSRLLLNFDFDTPGLPNVLRFVKEIDLTRVKYFDSEPETALNRILFHTTNLETAIFDNCLWITDDTIAPLVNCLRLTHLSLNGCPQVVLLPISRMSKLDTLQLAHCEHALLNEDIVAELDTNRLKHVRLPVGVFDKPDATVAAILRRFAPSLEILILEGQPHTRAQAGALTAAAFANSPPLPNLKTLQLIFCLDCPDSALVGLHTPKLTALAIVGWREVDVPALRTVLKSNPQVRNLCLTARNFSDSEAIEVLGLAPGSGPPVEINRLVVDNVAKLTDAFIYAMDGIPTLEELSIWGNFNMSATAIAWAKTRFPNLKFHIERLEDVEDLSIPGLEAAVNEFVAGFDE
ncbi:hypothetical protein HDU86_004594 [Geranomyces michiganensis]|nr:hypothetical protein HDU86_004594 [Geranomyces michiganensis]